MTLQTAEVIAFPVGVSREQFLKTARSRRKTVRPTCTVEIEEAAAANRSVTATNSDLRKERRDVWRAAEAATRYWRARLDFESAIGLAQSNDISEGRLHADVDRDNWMPMVTNYRKALVAQLLTPAWGLASVTWKRTVLARNDYIIGQYIKAERVEKAIADDLAFLAAHPTKRTGNVEACEATEAVTGA